MVDFVQNFLHIQNVSKIPMAKKQNISVVTKKSNVLIEKVRLNVLAFVKVHWRQMLQC